MLMSAFVHRPKPHPPPILRGIGAERATQLAGKVLFLSPVGSLLTLPLPPVIALAGGFFDSC